MLSFWCFTNYLGLLLLLIFGLHTLFITPTELFLGYVFNYLITIISFLWLLLRSRKKSETLGFIFMAISGIKFLFFFLLYKPFSIPVLEKKELFLSFFVPYAVCSFYEVYTLIKFLNKKMQRNKSEKERSLKSIIKKS